MKKILISIKPEYVAEILNHRKTLEIRKTAPKCELPCEVYIYCTKGKPYLRKYPFSLKERFFQLTDDNFKALNGKVVASFTLNKVSKIFSMLYGADEDECAREHCYETRELDSDELLKRSCLTYEQMRSYLGCLDDEVGYAWHIDNLVPFDRPKELKEFEHWVSYRSCEKCPYGESEIIPLCNTCREKVPLTNAPQSWCYCEVDE